MRREGAISVAAAGFPRHDDHMGDDQADDPFVRRLFRRPTGLRRRTADDDDRIVAVYERASGSRPFAICRDGLIVDPDGVARFIPFSDIEQGGYYEIKSLEREKQLLEVGGTLQEPLSITLFGGEVIRLPLDARPDGMSERLSIGRLVEQRVRMARASRTRS